MRRRAKWAILPGAAIAIAQAAMAQGLAQRIGAVRQGDVELHYAARPGVCGDGSQRMSIGRSMQMGNFEGDYGLSPCVFGPVRVRLRVDEGEVTDIRTSVGPPRVRAAGPPVTDLGAVPAGDAAAYFLHLGRTANGRVSDRALMPAVLADSSYPWRELLVIARDRATRGHATRTNAAFWLGRFAAAKLSGRENDLASSGDDADEERDARASAVFALSQLRNGEGIAPLIQVVRTNHDASLRRRALFWLGQSGDGRALQLFEEILAAR